MRGIFEVCGKFLYWRLNEGVIVKDAHKLLQCSLVPGYTRAEVTRFNLGADPVTHLLIQEHLELRPHGPSIGAIAASDLRFIS